MLGVDDEAPRLRGDAERNRERILATAAALIAERGLDVGHDEIARVAGVGVGTVYRRFPTRAALLNALYLDELRTMVAIAEEAAALDDPWAGIVQFLQRTFEQQAANRGLRELLLGSGEGVDLARAATDSIGPIIDRLVERAKAAGQLRPGVTATDVGVIPFMVNAVMSASRRVAPDLWHRSLDVILAGLRAEPAATALVGVPLRSDQLQAMIARRD